MTKRFMPSRALRELAQDQKGVAAPVIAALGVTLIAAAGLSLDVGLYYMNNRDLRSATEAAALAAAMKPSDAERLATEYLVKNGYSASELKNWEVGYYCANVVDVAYPAGSRFVKSTDIAKCPGSSVQNAVRLTTEKDSRRFLSSALGIGKVIPKLTATASAARIDEAGISITTGLLTVTNTLVVAVNNLLGALLGVQLNFSNAQVEALMGGNVDAGKFFDALARKTSKTGTYGQLMDGTYQITDIANAAAEAAYAPATKLALEAISTATKSRNYPVPFKQNGIPLFGLGIWKNTKIGSASGQASLRAGLNAYQLVTYAAQSGPGVINANNIVSLLAPGSRVEVVAIASGIQDRPRFAFGPAGNTPNGETSVGTSMLRIRLNVELLDLNLLGLVGTSAHVPLVLDVAAAEAKIAENGIECAGKSDQKHQTQVKVSTKSGLVNAYIGELKNPGKISSQMPALSANDFDAAKFFRLRVLGLTLANLQGKAFISSVFGFNNDEVLSNFVSVFGDDGDGVIGDNTQMGTGVVIGNKSLVGSTVTDLASSLLSSDLKSCTLEFICLQPDETAILNLRTVLDRTKDLLSGTGGLLGATVDPLLDNVLAALGVQLGHATVWVTGVRCGVPVLI